MALQGTGGFPLNEKNMNIAVDFIYRVLFSTLNLFLDASPYILFGILVAGLLRMFLSTGYVAEHLGRGRIFPVLKAALLGIPIPEEM